MTKFKDFLAIAAIFLAIVTTFVAIVTTIVVFIAGFIYYIGYIALIVVSASILYFVYVLICISKDIWEGIKK